MPTQKKKVCLISISLGKGGAEQSTALLSETLSHQGFDVHLVILRDIVNYTYNGELFNLGTYKATKYFGIGKILSLIKLRHFFVKHEFDVIIDNRTRPSSFKERVYLNYIYRKQRVIYVVRSSRLSNYLPLSRVGRKMVQRAAGIVSVSKQITSKLNTQFSVNAKTIYNPIKQLQVSDLSLQNKIVWAGRINDEVKNISLLLTTFAKIKAHSTQLEIYGDGPDLKKMIALTQKLKIATRVHFYPFTTAVQKKMATARFVILTSRYEGFPRVLIEALSVGTPVISVDCISGPREIITDGVNGLLVVNNDEKALSTAMTRMLIDDELYHKCKSNAKASVAHLSMDSIGLQWKLYIESLC